MSLAVFATGRSVRLFRTLVWLGGARPWLIDGPSHPPILQQLDVEISLGRPRHAGDVAQPYGGELERGLTVKRAGRLVNGRTAPSLECSRTTRRKSRRTD